MSRVPRILWILLAVGLLLRLAAIHGRGATALLHAPDEDELFHIAQNVAAGNGFTFHGAATAYRDLMLPAITAAGMALFGNTALPMLYLQALLSCATAWLLFRIARRRFNQNIALALSAVWLVYPAAILISAMLLTETLFVFWWVLAVDLHDRLEARQYDLKSAALLGFVLGLVMLTRAVGQVFLAAVLIYVALIRFETPRLLRWKAAFVILAVACLTVAPWMIRNSLAVGSFTLNTNSGMNMFIGNNPEANGSYIMTADMESRLPPTGEVARARVAEHLAWTYLRENSRHSIDMLGRKLAFLWSTDAALWIHYDSPRDHVSVSEQLRSMPVWRLLLVAVPYILLVGCGISGYYLVRHFDDRGLFLLATALYMGAILLAYGTARYHFPLMPGLLIGAGALVRPQVWISTPPWRRLFLLFTLGMLAGFWLLEGLTIAGL
jgi:4-amino-4-deoxy-L-arabinose transferase-like glycosyltransferase